MSVLLDKSEISYTVASDLHKSQKYHNSVHCSYYSCLQRMLHIKVELLGEDEDNFLGKSRVEENSSHILITNQIKTEARSKSNNHSELQNIFEILGRLKRNRVEADYKSKVILKEQSDASLLFAGKINKFLDNTFNLKNK